MKTVERAQELLTRIEEVNPTIHALLSVAPDVIEQAKAVDEKITAGTAGKLAGKFIAAKACICVEGLESNCASKTLEGWKATYDADAIAAIKKEDGIIIGVANMDEFACGAAGRNSMFDQVVNPATPDRLPGGSSSGSAAAVAAGFCDMALGTDTGGSIRVPANNCNVIGIKPSYGCVSRYGLIDLSMSLDQIGPLATSVQDAATLLSVIATQTDNEGMQLDKPIAPLHASAQQNITLGVSDNLFSLCNDERIVEHIKQLTNKYAEQFTSDVSSQQIDGVELAVQTYYPLVYVEFFSGTRKFDGRKFGKPIDETAGPEVIRRITGGKIISHAEHDGKFYKQALTVKKHIETSLAKAFESCDVLVLPVAPMLTPKVTDELSVEDEYAYDALTAPANLAGICAGTVPVGEIDGVPISVQVYAPAGKEDLLVSVMAGFEQLK